MKFTDILRKVIVEQSRMDVLVDKLTKPQGNKKPLLNNEVLFALIAADPESKINTDADIDSFKGDFSVVKKVGPYSQWLIKQYLSLVPMMGDGETPVPKEDEKLYKSVLNKNVHNFLKICIKRLTISESFIVLKINYLKNKEISIK